MKNAFAEGRRWWMIGVVGLGAGLSAALLNGLLILNFGRVADALVEGAGLVGLGIALTGLYLEWQRVRESAARLHLLHALTTAVNAPFEIDTILQAAIDGLTAALGLDSGGTGLLEDGQTVVVVQAEHVRPGMEPSLGTRISLDPQRAPWAAPLWHGEAVIVEDVQADMRFAGLEDIFRRRGTRAYLALPLFADNHLHGAIGLHGSVPRVLAREDIELARAAAAAIANAVAKAKRLADARRRAAHLAVADSVAQRLLSLNQVSQLSQQVTDALATHFPDWNVFLFLIDGPGGDLVLRGKTTTYTTTAEVDVFRLPFGIGLAGWAAREGNYLLVNDISGDDRYVAEGALATTRAELAVPIQGGGEVLGVLDVQANRVGEFTEDDARVFNNVALDVGAALVNARLLRDLQIHLANLERLQAASLKILASNSLDEMLPQLCVGTAQAVGSHQVSLMLVDSDGYCYRWAGHNYRMPLQPHLVRPQGVSMQVIRSGEGQFFPDLRHVADRINPNMLAEDLRAAACLPLAGRVGRMGVMWVTFQTEHPFPPPERTLLTTFAGQAALAIEQLRLFDDGRRRLRELEAVQLLSSALRQVNDRKSIVRALLETALSILETTHGDVLLPDETGQSLLFAEARGWPKLVADLRLPMAGSLSGRVFRNGVPVLITDLLQDPDFAAQVTARIERRDYCGLFAPIRDEDRVIGVIFMSVERPRLFTEDDLRLLSTLAEITGTALRRESLRAEAEHRIRQLAALHAIDAAIASSLNLRLTLNVLLEQTLAELRVDCGDVLLNDPLTNTLAYAAGLGFKTRIVERSHLRLGEGIGGRVALERRAQYNLDLRRQRDPLERTEFIAVEGLVGCCAAPLMVKGQVKGVLEVFTRSPLNLDGDALSFFETLAEQAAIAIDNAELFDGLQRKSAELLLAYDTTIEGWVHALDLRDKETEGHTRRVTEMTLKLARAFSLSEIELVHIRRGALLHDIGKMGIPDSILLKPGPLTDVEWEVMRRHPQYAYEMLSPITFLRPALDIPYCHHERWDGSGYPRGLTGEQVPLAARLFATVDVFDALTSDRPYRLELPRAEALAHLRENAGKLFDPQAVDQLRRLLEEGQ